MASRMQVTWPSMTKDVMTDEKQIQKRSSDRLLLLNVPTGCDAEYLRDWVESRGYRTFGVELVEEVVSRVSPGFAQVQLMDPAKLDEAERALDGLQLRGNAIRARRVVLLPDDMQFSAGHVA
jgi:hypothetical protein